MNLELILSIVALLTGIVTLVSFFDGKIKDAEKMGALKQRVVELENKQEKNDATKTDINSILVAIGRMTEQINNLQKDINELKEESRCIERRKTP